MKKKLILDTDVVGDDILAIYLASLHPDLDLLGVSTVNGASGAVEQATNVALNALDIAGRSDVGVHVGASRPFLSKSEEEREAPVHFERRLTGTIPAERLKGFNPPAPRPSRKPSDVKAVDFILETVRKYPGEVTIVATGPLTNLGLALLQAPEIASLAKGCIVMGGSFKVPGNITPVVEYNIWSDPEAARLVCNASWPLTIVPLDVCEDGSASESMLTRDVLEDLASVDNPVARDIRKRFPVYIDIWRKFFGFMGFPMDDVIAVALLVDPDICRYDPRCYVDVELAGRYSRGQMIPFRAPCILDFEPGRANADVACRIDGRRFMECFLRTVSR